MTEKNQEKENKKVITVNHVLVGIGLIGIGVMLYVMGYNWVSFGTPFYGGGALNVFGDQVLDMLLSIAAVTAPLVLGISGLRKSKHNK